ncbi:HlyD family secretion protein [Pseudoalteromonas sp. MMG010]|uniref:HlyD family secretion protein n=1 Tax=Pseudoalteromonas sp. MMG010 TaxID=2822685 RepID=UPI001B39EA61|nr:HlyD family secretion protein [Pseudoalteromonas sp. MMG010]MBQ4833620.1 HlyD family secretion protein [Pseudoalteromonas sp. MMG010]
MTPDQKFTRYVRFSLIAFVCLFIYYLIADMTMPVTPQARVYHSVVQVAPQISGQVTNVRVSNNQTVKVGDILFEIDPTPYQLALAQAQLTLDDAKLQNQRLDTNVKALKAQIVAAKAKQHEQKLSQTRAEALYKKRSISEQALEAIHANFQASKANTAALEAQLAEATLARGKSGNDNLAIRHAANQLAQAKLNLSYTQVHALTDGVVSNLQLLNGAYAITGSPLLAIVAKKADLVADFREKSLKNMTLSTQARVVFDNRPGEVYSAQIALFEAGVSDGQLSANGLLSTTDTSSRWVRDAQRQRIHLTLNEHPNLIANMPSGARATVQLLPESTIGQWFAIAQIRFISWLHYIY